MGKRPIIFGEVLFDHFPTGERVLGGAPFNVAWNLQGFGLQPLFISRVGQDAEGDEIKALMDTWRMDLSGLQTDAQYPTGSVAVSFHNQQPSYNILDQQAYDFIDQELVFQSVEKVEAGLIYHGSLALRKESNFYGLQALQEKLNTLIFLDVNLRSPWWTSSILDTIVQRAHWLKVNDEEILEIAKDAGINSIKKKMEAGSQELLKKFFLQGLILTKGGEGASLVSADGVMSCSTPEVSNLVDTVGAGDAFASVCIVGLMERWPQELMLQRALEFASKVCGIRGATHPEREFYQQVVAGWQES